MNLKRLKFLDKYFLVVLAIILVFGLVTLSSASSGITSDAHYYLKKQALFLVLGIVLAIFILRFDYTQLEKYSTYLYVLSLLILVMVLVFGKEVRGTTGWIGFGSLPLCNRRNLPKYC